MLALIKLVLMYTTEHELVYLAEPSSEDQWRRSCTTATSASKLIETVIFQNKEEKLANIVDSRSVSEDICSESDKQITVDC